MIDFKDYIDKFQADLMDFIARHYNVFTPKIRFKAAALISKICSLLPFCRYKFVVDSMQKHLKISEDEAKKHAERLYRNLLLNAVEMASLRYMSSEELLNKLEVKGVENFDEAMAHKKGVVAMSIHFGLWEFLPHWLDLNGYTTTTVVRRQNNKYADKWFEDMRHCHGAKTTDSGFGMRVILRALKKGEVLALIPDQDNGKQGIFVKFLGEYASAPVGPAVISLKTGAPLIVCMCYPNYTGGKHLVKIFKPVYVDNLKNDVQGRIDLTQQYTTFFEEIVKEDPDQWFWCHRRWKTRPENCPENEYVKCLGLA